MSTYEICKYIMRVMATKAAEVVAYSDYWSADFCKQEVKSSVPTIMKVKEFDFIDPNDLTASEMDDLGFGKWDKESGLRLIPLWLVPFLADEFEGGSISSDKRVTIKRENMDSDHRFGCVAYGVFK